jgi:hypothetical protein
MKQVAGHLGWNSRSTVKWQPSRNSDRTWIRRRSASSIVEPSRGTTQARSKYEPLLVEKQVLIIYAGTNGFIDELPLTTLKKYEQELYSFISRSIRTFLPTFSRSANWMATSAPR